MRNFIMGEANIANTLLLKTLVYGIQGMTYTLF